MNNEPTTNEITDLINRAKAHELGLDFLMNGSLDSVAMTFGVHAFVVDGARDELAKPPVNIESREVAVV